MSSTSNDQPATFDQLKIGTRVKCIFRSAPSLNERFGKTGTIIALNPKVSFNAITIEWDDDVTWNTNWGKASSFTVVDGETAATSASGTPVNDHVCPTCQNNKCSKSEKLCWKCGNPL